MHEPIIDDALWGRIAPLVAPFSKTKGTRGGRAPVSDRAAMTGILFVLRTGIRWNALPPEVGAGSGISCWRRLRYWQSMGIWGALQDVLRESLREEAPIDFSRTRRGRYRGVGAHGG